MHAALLSYNLKSWKCATEVSSIISYVSCSQYRVGSSNFVPLKTCSEVASVRCSTQETPFSATPRIWCTRLHFDVPWQECDIPEISRHWYGPKAIFYHEYVTAQRQISVAEQVDGEILACCDAESLQELGVTSRIQQICLAKIIVWWITFCCCFSEQVMMYNIWQLYECRTFRVNY